MLKPFVLAAALMMAGAAAVAAPRTYVLDPNHSQVLASWTHFGFSNPFATFTGLDGRLIYDADKPEASSVEVTIPLSGLDAHVDAFNEHLRSADFFDAERFPNARFRSTRVEPAGEGRLRVHGELTIKDITRPVVLDTRINRIGEHPMARPKRGAAGFDATATVKRSDFGLGLAAPNVSDEVTLRITVEALEPKPEGRAP